MKTQVSIFLAIYHYLNRTLKVPHTIIDCITFLTVATVLIIWILKN